MNEGSESDEKDLLVLLGCWAEDRWMRGLRDYLQRGRCLKDASVETLSARWISLLTEWAKRPLSQRNPECDEIEYEMELRGKALPYELIAGAIQKIGKAGREELERQKHEEPELDEQGADTFRRELETFILGQNGTRH